MPPAVRSQPKEPTDCRRAIGALCAIIITGLLMTGCHATRRPAAAEAGGATGERTVSATQTYAAEVLGHMMAVVTGAAGQAGNRPLWRTRGLGMPLRFSAIQTAMVNPDFDKSRLLVYDTEIIGLSRVLYHYDPRLNLFKGQQPFYSPFPSEELIALRLLLIGKIARGEIIRLDALIARLPAIRDSGGLLPRSDYDAMGLSAEETILLSDALRSEPALADYIRHPAIAAALARMGLLDAPQRQRPLARMPSPAAARGPSTLALIAMLPSFESDFSPVVRDGREILAASADYRQRTADLMAQVISASGNKTRERYRQRYPDRTLPAGDRWQAQWRAFVDRRIAFFMPDAPPLAITAYNAQTVIQSICPDADLNIIIVGKDVVRSMDIRAERDVFPHTNRFFVDASDVKYQLVGEIIAQIGGWLADKTGSAFYQEVLGKAS